VRRSTVSTVKKSQAKIPWAWDRRNSDQLGPSRLGAGPMPAHGGGATAPSRSWIELHQDASRCFEGFIGMQHVARERGQVAGRELHGIIPRARAQPPADHEDVFDHAGLMGLGVAECAGVEIELVDLERTAPIVVRQRSPGPPRCLSGAHDRNVRGADDTHGRALFLHEPRKWDLKRGSDRPQRFHAWIRASGLKLRERGLAAETGAGASPGDPRSGRAGPSDP
jgi:hypothetical protein